MPQRQERDRISQEIDQIISLFVEKFLEPGNDKFEDKRDDNVDTVDLHRKNKVRKAISI